MTDKSINCNLNTSNNLNIFWQLKLITRFLYYDSRVLFLPKNIKFTFKLMNAPLKLHPAYYPHTMNILHNELPTRKSIFLPGNRLKFHFLPLFHIFLFVLLITPSFIIITLFITPDAACKRNGYPALAYYLYLYATERGLYNGTHILTMTNKLSIKYGSSSTTLQIRSTRCIGL